MATNPLAAPPKALNSATNCGIAVIFTYLASIDPMVAPIIRPRIIHSIFISVYLRVVAIIAINIPIAENLFPFRAVLGEDSCFNPIIKIEADIK